jgi:hypothetical protein
MYRMTALGFRPSAVSGRSEAREEQVESKLDLCSNTIPRTVVLAS